MSAAAINHRLPARTLGLRGVRAREHLICRLIRGELVSSRLLPLAIQPRRVGPSSRSDGLDHPLEFRIGLRALQSA